MSHKILIIEDEQRMSRILELMLEENGFTVQTASDGIEGMAAWKKFKPDVVLTDIKMPRADGLAVLEFKNKNSLPSPLIILTAFGTIEKAVHAIKKGAFDYLTKPFNNIDVIKVVRKAIEDSGDKKSDLMKNNTDIIGSSSEIKKVLKNIKMVAKTKTSVLITGESGTGKELVARNIHRLGNRSDRPMVKVNCSAIPGELLESELFGHIKGSFTGAVASRTGSFQKAHTGTIFLDEIGDLPMGLQPKLLHAVEDKTVAPVGASSHQSIDVKIISASNRNFQEMMAENCFRTDLYYRLNTFNIHLPPLKERIEDIKELCHFFISQFSAEFDKQVTGIDGDALEVLESYQWPGNIRELRNVIERAVLICEDSQIRSVDISPDLLDTAAGGHAPHKPSELDLEARERMLIQRALEKTGGNQVHAAKLLNISRNTLRYRLKKYRLQ